MDSRLVKKATSDKSISVKPRPGLMPFFRNTHHVASTSNPTRNTYPPNTDFCVSRSVVENCNEDMFVPLQNAKNWSVSLGTQLAAVSSRSSFVVSLILPLQISALVAIRCAMLVVVDEREMVRDAYRVSFLDAGVSVAIFAPSEILEWLSTAGAVDVQSVEGIVVGAAPHREALLRTVRLRSTCPIITLIESPSLEHTLSLFASGSDDVVRKPVHAREILARIATIKRRISSFVPGPGIRPGLVVFFDGRDPEIDGTPFILPRRERRILEFLVSHAGKRVTKTQIFNAIYGLFDEEVDECVVESHISKLRKKLRSRLGFDPIDAKRYLGYQYCKTSVPAYLGGENTAPAAKEMVAA